MPSDYDIVIVGAGLAGTCSALHLAGDERILLVDAGDPPAGASSAAAGLVNPFMARKAKAAWRHTEALEALSVTLRLAGASDLHRQTGVLRPARDGRQAGDFRRTATAHDECSWLSRDDCGRRHPEIVAPHGALFVINGGAVDIAKFIRAALGSLRSSDTARVRTRTTLAGFDERDGGVAVSLDDGSVRHELRCGVLLLAAGAGYRSMEPLRRLGLHPVKGQTVAVRTPRGLAHLPHVAGSGYVVFGEGHATIGSSFEHEFKDALPDPEVSRRLLERASGMVPALRDAEIVSRSAGIRVNVAGSRLPMVGPLPGHRRVWTLTGLGSRGLLTAPLIASELRSYLSDPARIPLEIRIREDTAIRASGSRPGA